MRSGSAKAGGSSRRTTAHLRTSSRPAEPKTCAWPGRHHRTSRAAGKSSTPAPSTRDDQPLWLFRNSAAAEIPFVGQLFGNWSRTPDASGTDPDDAFRKFHRTSVDRNIAPWNSLADWHDTSAWFANRSSYDLVSGAVADLTLLPYGTERLLVLAAQRPLTSWVPFTTYPPSGRDELRVAVSFSGDLDNRGPRVYQYVFEAR